MSEARFHWLLDVGIPRISDNSLDVVYAEDLSRIPGPVGLTEAVALDRSLITRDQSFRGSWALPLAHHGIVILEGASIDGREVERNLQHLEFRLKQQGGSSNPLENRRFLIKMDRAILQIEPDGCELDFELWRRVYVQSGRAPSAHPAPV
jgi:hypothetical protein